MSRVLLVDSQPAMRRAVAGLLEQMQHSVVGEAANGQDALNLFRQEQPQLVILELAGEQLAGLELLRRLRARSSSARLLVYSAQDPQLFAGLCLQAGADGYVGKQEAFEQLAAGIKVVLGGRRFFPRDAVDVRHHALPPVPAEREELQHLSAREITVLQQLAQGRSNQDIATQLAISFKTVSTYKTRLLEKLHAHSLVELANIARRNGLVGPDPKAPACAELSSEQQQHLYLLQAMVDASPFAMFMRDTQGRLLLCNKHFLLQHGATSAAIGTSILEAHWFPADHTARMQARYLQCVAQGESYSDEVLISLHGQQRALHVWCVPYRDQNGQLLGLVGGSQDLSEHHQQLSNLRTANAKAQADNARKSRLLAFLAPLLRHLPATSEQRRLELLVALEINGLAEQPESTELAALTASSVESFSSARRAAISLIQSAPAPVWLDPHRYQHLVHSLLSLAPEHQAAELDVQVQTLTGGQTRVRLHLRPLPAGLKEVGLDLFFAQSLASHLGGTFAVDASGVCVVLTVPSATDAQAPDGGP